MTSKFTAVITHAASLHVTSVALHMDTQTAALIIQVRALCNLGGGFTYSSSKKISVVTLQAIIQL